jgi:biotin carboxylase
MKKLLVLNGSHSDVPLIEAGKRLGFHVVTTGNDPGLVGHAHGDEYRKADFSDMDEVLGLARALNVDAICSCANDFGAITAAYVAEKMGLPGHDPYETALTLHHKHRFKDFALSHGVSTPRAVQYSSPEEACQDIEGLRYPLIVKPVDMTGGKGVSTANSADEYRRAVEHAFSSSRIGRFLVEEFVRGTYHSFSTFVLDGKIAFTFSDNEYSLNSPFHVSTSAGPATGIEKVRGQLIAEAERIIGLLSLCNGIFHIQYIHAADKAWIIEITRRCSGDFYPYPVKFSSGLDWAEWIVKAESGSDCGDFPPAVQRGFFGRHCVVGRRHGVIRNIAISRELEANVIDRFFNLRVGDVIGDRWASKLAGVIFLQYGSAEEMLEKSVRMNELAHVEVE